MPATEKKQMYLYKTGDGNPPSIVRRKIAATQGIFMPGAPCYISTSGTVKLSDTSDGTGDTHHGFIVGLAAGPVTTAWPLTAELAADTVVLVQIIDSADTYVVYVESGGSDSAAAQTVVGDQLGLVVSTTAGEIGYTTANIAETTNVAVQVDDLWSNLVPEKETTSTSPGRVTCHFLPAVIDVVRA